jgi:DNA-binding transcriptional LysR family regulator
MDRLNQMRVFVTVVERRSFTGAAGALGMAKSTVSRQIADLETRLGVRLLYRTTRVLHPTEVGRTYFDRCQAILADVAEADSAVSEGGEEVRGTLRVACAALFATLHLIEPIATYRARHPAVAVDLRVDDRYVNLVEDGLDLAIRIIGSPPDSSLVARRLATTTHHLVASPAFVAEHGIRSIDDLSRVPALCREPPGGTWTLFDPGGEERKVAVQPALSCNQAEPLVRAALAGVGVGLFPDFMAVEHLASGRLVRVLPAIRGSSSGVYAIYPHRRLLSSRVRLFIDHLAEVWETAPWET